MNAGTVHGRVAAVHGTVLEIDVEGPVSPPSTALRCRLSDDGWVTAVVVVEQPASSRPRSTSLGPHGPAGWGAYSYSSTTSGTFAITNAGDGTTVSLP